MALGVERAEDDNDIDPSPPGGPLPPVSRKYRILPPAQHLAKVGRVEA